MVTSALRANEHIVQISKSSVVHVRLFEAGSRRQRDALTKEWMLLDEALGLFLSSSQDDLKPCWDFRTVEVWWKTAGCFWPSCICTGSKPYHKMRVCSRCLRAVYCSERCQSSTPICSFPLILLHACATGIGQCTNYLAMQRPNLCWRPYLPINIDVLPSSVSLQGTHRRFNAMSDVA